MPTLSAKLETPSLFKLLFALMKIWNPWSLVNYSNASAMVAAASLSKLFSNPMSKYKFYVFFAFLSTSAMDL